MPMVTERFSWMGVAFAVPAEWELTAIREMRGAWRATFADRRHERLSVQWRPVASRPRLDLMVAAALEEAESRPVPLRGLPAGWVGLGSRGAQGGAVEHLSGYLDAAQLLIEAVLATPAELPRHEPAGLLDSFGPQDEDGGNLVWQAMGMRLTAPPGYCVRRFSSQPGDTTWHLERRRAADESLSVRRLAMPAFWLRDSVAEWLRRRPSVDARELGRETCRPNGHEGCALLTRRRRSMVSHWRGRDELRRDLAWLCNVETRVFHVCRTVCGRGEVPPLPPGFGVGCCRVPYLRRRAGEPAA